MRVYVDYQGKRIRLTEERLAHILEHAEMRGVEPRIAQTLAQPEKVVESWPPHREQAPMRGGQEL